MDIKAPDPRHPPVDITALCETAPMSGQSLRVLITGAARAIGEALTVELADRGHDVIATARNVNDVAPYKHVRRLQLDVTSDESIAGCLAQAGDFDVLVNNAALSGSGPLEDFPIDRLRSVLETNTIGPLRMIQAVVPAWRERNHGLIVNVSSVQGRVGSPTEGVYCASKFALEALSETLHYELGHFGIRTLIVEPGYIAPGMKPSDRHTGPDAYQDLWAQWSGTAATVTGSDGRTPSPVAAAKIADAIEDDDAPLRLSVGADAELILDTWKALSDADFEAAMRSTLSLDW